MGFIISKKNALPNFWVLHILGWICFMLVDLGVTLPRFNNFTDFLVWLDSDIMGFIVITALRYFYKNRFKLITNIIPQFFVILFSSAIAGFLWFFLRGFSHVLFFPSAAISFKNYYRAFTDPFGLGNSIFWLVFPIFAWSLAYLGIKYHLNLLEERSKLQKIQLFAKNAQLQMLRYQLNPHFLFNSLNSIQGLMYKDVERADLMLTELSEFLRYTLKYNQDIFIPLKDEFEIIEKYLSIEKIRFSDRLQYRIELPPDLRNAKILCFLTQPFVENAIKHGMNNNTQKKVLLIINASIENSCLVIRILNSGQWRENPDESGTGLKNTRERLQNAYQNNQSMNITEEQNMVQIELKIPYNE